MYRDKERASILLDWDSPHKSSHAFLWDTDDGAMPKDGRSPPLVLTRSWLWRRAEPVSLKLAVIA